MWTISEKPTAQQHLNVPARDQSKAAGDSRGNTNLRAHWKCIWLQALGQSKQKIDSNLAVIKPGQKDSKSEKTECSRSAGGRMETRWHQKPGQWASALFSWHHLSFPPLVTPVDFTRGNCPPFAVCQSLRPRVGHTPQAEPVKCPLQEFECSAGRARTLFVLTARLEPSPSVFVPWSSQEPWGWTLPRSVYLTFL